MHNFKIQNSFKITYYLIYKKEVFNKLIIIVLDFDMTCLINNSVHFHWDQ